MGPSATEYTDFQRWFINILSYVQVSLTTVEKDDDDETFVKQYRLVPAGWIRTILYIFLASNTFFKFMYLLLLVFGYFGPIEFLDMMSALLWMLMCMEILQELAFYIQTYPLYEVLASLWKLENEIYQKLGRPYALTKKSRAINFYTLILHTGILVVGCVMIGGQFLSDPKYAVYTYSAFKRDNIWLLTLFTIHEVCFMWHAWTGYLSIVTISTLNAVELTFILDGMSEALSKLTPKYPFKLENFQKIPKRIHIWDLEFGRSSNGQLDVITKNSQTLEENNVEQLEEYKNIEILLTDYGKLMLVSDQLNGWCQYRIVGVHFIGYCQFISDVFMMIRILRLTDFDIATVMWYGEDALACLYMIFRMFSLMSRVTPASENFMRQFQHFLRVDNPMRKRLIKVSRTLHVICLRLGPSPVRPQTVGAAVMILMNYYLCVALWE